MRLTAVLLAGFTFLVSAQSSAFAVSEKDALGVWRHPDNGSLIRIYRCGGGTCAKIVKVKETGRKDVHNPDPKLRNRPVEGVVIMQGGKKVGPVSWKGKLYNTLDGGTYSGTLTLVGPKKLKLSGCVLFGAVCLSKYWTKVR